MCTYLEIQLHYLSSFQEVDPNIGFNELPEEYFENNDNEAMAMSKEVMQEIISSFPGIDEAMSYTEVMK